MLSANGERLIEMYSELHSTAPHYGNGDNLHIMYKHLKPYLLERGSVKMLDYGCGKAEYINQPQWYLGGHTLQQLHPNITSIYCYDPAVPQFATPPSPTEKFDIVLCMDVVEHILDADIDQFFAQMQQHLTDDTMVVLSTTNIPALTKNVFDGTDVHVNKQSVRYWEDKMAGINKYCLRFATLINNKLSVVMKYK